MSELISLRDSGLLQIVKKYTNLIYQAYTFKCYLNYRGVMIKTMDCGFVMSSYSSRATTFTFGQKP